MTVIKKYKRYLGISALIWAVCFVAFASVYFLVIVPQYETRKRFKKELAESKQNYDLAKKASQEDTKARMNEEISLLQNKLHNFVIDFKSSADLTFEISRIAGESKVTSFNIQSDDMRDVTTYADPNNIFEKHITVSFIAGFREFAIFLNSLERHQPVLFINEFSLSRQNNDNKTYQVTIDIAAFVRKQQIADTKNKNAELIVGAKF